MRHDFLASGLLWLLGCAITLAGGRRIGKYADRIEEAEQGAKKGEERSRQEVTIRGVLLDNMPCIAMILKKQTREIVACNEIARKFGAVVGKTCFESVCASEAHCPFCRAPELWKTGERQEVEAEYLGRYWHGIWVPYSDDLFVHYVFDITEWKRAVEALKESEERLRTLYDSTPAMLHSIDREGRIVSVSDHWLQKMGYSRGDVVGRRSVEFLTEESARFAREVIIPEFMRTGSCRDVPYQMVKKDGSTMDVLLSATSEKDRDDRVVRSMAVINDITERKRAEEESEKLQLQLQQAMKMEAVGRLAGGVAHDFNNLLTAILGNVDMALRRIPASDPLGEMLAEVRKAADRAARLTHQLLAFSRRQIIEPKVLDLNKLVSELHPMLVRLIGENIRIETVLGRGLGAVKVDHGQFEQILVNLSVNSRDAMPDGGKMVIETSNADIGAVDSKRHPGIDPGRYVVLSVSDTGHGMTGEVKARIFEPFFTTKPSGTGTGLGMSMIYGSVKQAGGHIEVDSEVGRGTTVRIYLPRLEEKVPKARKAGRRTDLPGGTETVLFVEDEEIVRNLGIEIIRMLGYNVLNAPNGEEAIAIAKARKDSIDILITDVVMPGMNGPELAAQLVKIHPETKVLFTSGYTEDAILRHGVLGEGLSFLGKPYVPPELARKIREVLDGE